MRKLLLAALVLFQTSVFAQTTWTVDKAHSKLGFSITHLGISDVSGHFRNFDVTVTSSKEDMSDAVFELKAETNSIDTEIEMRDNHLKNADFFNVEKFPAITFKSNSISKAGEDRYKLSGNLTMNGVTKPVTMDLWYRGSVTNAMNKKLTAGFQLTGTLKRSDFNLGPKFPAPMLSDDVRIKADGEFTKK